MNTATKTLLAILAGTLVSPVYAEQPEAMLKVKKSTFVNLVDLLVQRGVINKQEGKGLVTAAEQEAAAVEVESPATPSAKGNAKSITSLPVSYTHLTLPTIYSV